VDTRRVKQSRVIFYLLFYNSKGLAAAIDRFPRITSANGGYYHAIQRLFSRNLVRESRLAADVLFPTKHKRPSAL